MFNNLKAEMAKAEASKMEMAKVIGVSYNTFRAKLKGRTEWKITEMVAMQEALNQRTGTYITIDDLFKK